MGITYNKQLVKKDRAVSSRGPRDLQRQQFVPSHSSDDRLVEELRHQIMSLTEKLQSSPASVEGMFTDSQVNDEIAKAINSETAQLKLDYEKKLNTLEVQVINLNNQINTLSKDKDDLISKLRTAEVGVEDRVYTLTNKVKYDYDKLLDERDAKITHMEDSYRIEISGLKDKITTQLEMINTLKDTQKSSVSAEVLEKLLADTSLKIERMAANMGGADPIGDPNRPQMESVFVDPSESGANKLEHNITVEDVSLDKKEAMASKVDKLKSLMGKLPSKKPV